VLSGVLWVLGTGAQWRELPDRYPPFQTYHRRFQQWVRNGKLEKVLGLLAKHLHERGKLSLREAFIDAMFASAKKGVLRSVLHAAARGQRSSLSPLITVFLSPSVYKALRPMKANSSKRSWQEASSTNSRPASSATELMTPTPWTGSSKKNTASNSSRHIEGDGARRPRMVDGCGATGNAGVWSGYLLGCTGFAGSSLVTSTTSRTFSVWSGSPVSCSC
jgi:transposase